MPIVNRKRPFAKPLSEALRTGLKMQCLDVTLPTPAQNLALDEALLEEAEADGAQAEVLRIWESTCNMVVVGRSSRVEDEVNTTACKADGVPVLRRSSGGAAVVAGRGCLMYAVVLSYEVRPELVMLDAAHRFVLETIAGGLSQYVDGITIEGTSDLARGGRKFSGNSLRCRRKHLLYHGSILYDFPLECIGRYLRSPPRQPDYRGGRTHEEFVANIPCRDVDLRAALRRAWGGGESRSSWPVKRVQSLAETRYDCDAWTNLR